jgi:hypothetical protein
MQARIVAFTVSLIFALPALAEPLSLRPRRAPGDSYELSLRATTSTETSLAPAAGKAFHENVQLDYRATVVVLEVDDAGQPLRERHYDAQLSYMRPEASRALFEKATYQVRRENGEIHVTVRGERLDPRYEAVVAKVLASQFEYSEGPALFDPGRPVEVGDSWELDAKRARLFLRQRGIDATHLAGSPTARLERRGEDASGERVIRFDIPIERFALAELPENARTSDSRARYGGEIRLSANGAPVGFSSNLEMSVQGVVPAPRVAHSVPWSFQRSQLSDQQSLPVESVLVSGL